MKCFYLDQVDSTNLQVKRMIKDGETMPFYLTANSQTAGRGRLSRSFYSPEDTGLYLSVAIPYQYDYEIVSVTAKSAVAVSKALEKYTDKKIGIKWVNDIYIDNLKVCGILAEAVSENNSIIGIIIGIGVNLTTTEFPEEISKTAGAVGIDISKDILAKEITENILKTIYKDDFIDYYREHSVVLGKEIYYIEDDIKISAIASEIDNSGALIVINNNGEIKKLSTGEITVRIK